MFLQILELLPRALQLAMPLLQALVARHCEEKVPTERRFLVSCSFQYFEFLHCSLSVGSLLHVHVISSYKVCTADCTGDPEQTQRRRMMQQGKDGRVAGDSSDRGSLGPCPGRNVYTESYVQGRIQKRKQRVASARSSRCRLHHRTDAA